MSVFNDIEGAKTLFDYRTKKRGFQNYSSIYACTNENVDGYFKLFDWDKTNSALLTCGSGDQALHAIYYGTKNIDTFDSNVLSKYYLEYKLAAIKAFTYEEYLNFITNVCGQNNDLEKKHYKILRKYLSEDAECFWDAMYSYNDYISNIYPVDNKSLFRRISYSIMSFINLKKCLTYLTSEDNYNRLRKNIWEVNVSFCNINATELNNNSRKYDKIFLSNIADYIENMYSFYPMLSFRDLCTDLIKNNLNDEGDLMLYYLYNTDKNGVQKCIDNKIMRNVEKRNEYFSDISNLLLFDSINPHEGYTKDGVLVYKKR